jgi:hypothetical protein
MFDSLFPEAADTALSAKASRKPDPTQSTQRFSAWGTLTATVKGVAAGAAQGIGSTADILGAFGQVAAVDARPGGMFSIPERNLTDVIKGGTEQELANKKLLQSGIDYNSEAGRNFRNVAKDYTPDPVTTHVAESAVFNLFRMGSKALTAAATLGNIPGAVVAGTEEAFTQSDEMAQQGVGLATRTKVGVVNAAINSAGFALPAAGKTWMQTGALALVGGPASFMAQNAATKEILQAADYTKQAEQFDPFDPVGLALSTVLPLGFGALAMRGAKVGKTVDAPAMHPSDDVVDAARVSLLRENMDATNPVRADVAQADAHAAAYTKAMEQQANGERVQVLDVAPEVVPFTGKPTESPNFKAWFGDSKVVDEAGAPMVVYHGTASDFDSFDAGKVGAAIDSGKLGEGFYFSQSNMWAESYAKNAAKKGGAANVLPVYISLKNPLVLDGAGGYLQKLEAIGEDWDIKAKPALDSAQTPNAEWSKEFTAAAKARGFDGVVLPSKFGDTEYMAFDARQIKSAIGNSGKFDPNSASLTDNTIADWGAGLSKALSDMRAEVDKLNQKQAKAQSERAGLATERIANVQDQTTPARAQTQAAPDQAVSPVAGNAATAPDVPRAGAADIQADGVKVSPLEARIAELEARNPATLDAPMPNGFDDQGKSNPTVSAREYLENIKREAAQEDLDARLIDVAATCFLGGAL